MARIRSIKPEFWTSEQIVECSVEARLLFIGIWTFCDDNGVHPLSERRIKMEVFPADDLPSDSIRGMLVELYNNGLIGAYVADNKEYISVTGWKKHQKIDKPTYRFPKPEEGVPLVLAEPSATESSREESSGVESILPTKAQSIYEVPEAEEDFG